MPNCPKCKSKRFKNYLYHGKIDLLIDEVTKLAPKRPSLISEVGYFKRYINFMNYPLLRLKKLPCGSGVMESAVRRVINLRFKAPSSFWKVNNVQKLIFLRATFLSKRWNIMISNLTQKNFSLNLLKSYRRVISFILKGFTDDYVLRNYGLRPT